MSESAGGFLTAGDPVWAPRSATVDDATVDDEVVHVDDEELLRATRAGDMAAYASLYGRHSGAALSAARAIGGAGIAQDLVSEAFAKVLKALLRGAGPDRSFRPYLITTVRNLYVDGVRRSAHETPIADMESFDAALPDTIAASVERAMMLDLLASLPARWSEILWRTVVLGEPLAVVAAKMGLNPNSAAALSFRARAGLRRAYWDQVSVDGGAQADGA